MGRKRLRQFQLAFDRGMIRRLQLRLQESRHLLHDLVDLHSLKLRLRHPGKFAEARDDGFQIGNLRQQRRRALAKNLVELFRTLLPRPHQVLHGQLQGKQGILELMRQAAGQFPPGRHPLSLHQALPSVRAVHWSCG